jgi:hypothetical protein
VQVDEHNKVARLNGQEIREGDFISLNGTTGAFLYRDGWMDGWMDGWVGG